MAVLNNNIEKIYNLTPMQEGMLFHYMLNKKSTAYVIQFVFDIKQNMDSNCISKSLSLMSEKYDVMRSLIVFDKVTEPCQVLLKERKLEFEEIDLSEQEDKETQDKLVEKILEDDIERGFDLQRNTLLRVKKIKLGENNEKLVFSNHHIIMDGWCNTLVYGEFFENYKRLCNGESYDKIKKEKSSKKITPYSEYIKWLNKKDKVKALEYWKNLLDGYEGDCEIRPMSKPEPNNKQMQEVAFRFDSDIICKIKKIAQNANCTINTVLETAFGIVLQVYNNTNDVVFGKVVSGRNVDIPGIEEMVGLFINTIPVRVSIDKNTTVEELLQNQQKQGNDSGCFDFFSLSEIQNTTIQGKDLIKVLYVFENYVSNLDVDDILKADGKITFDRVREQTNYDITFSVSSLMDEMDAKIMYDPNCFCEKEVENIFKRFVKVIASMEEIPNEKVCELNTVTEEEKKLILETFNATETDYPKDKTIVELFEEQTFYTPNNIALTYEGQKVSYRELNEKANALAHKLREMGVKPDDFVAIIAGRSTEMIAAIYAVIKAGAAYVPIDPTYPEERIKFMLEDCQPKVLLLYGTEYEIDLPKFDLKLEEAWKGNTENPEKINKPEDLIYCIYTSGTTGMPKGVLIEHYGVTNLANYMRTEIHINNSENVMLFANYVFDGSVWEILMAHMNGATLHIPTDETIRDIEGMKTYVAEHNINISYFPPSYYEQGKFELDGYVVTAGSQSNQMVVKEATKYSDYINSYGPTEATICASNWICGINEEVPECIPIVKPISNKKVYILNGDNLCGIGIPGELCIAGDGLARGYLNRPELTAEKFVNNPFGEGRMYRSGDLARWLPDGNIEFLGRIDEQVKIRGFRIELGEIESRIREIKDIKDCAVIAKEDSTGDKAIYAYYTGDQQIEEVEIREKLKENLPDYMIPSYMMQIENIPVTRNRKLDRRALPEIEMKAVREYVAPRDETEEQICKIFCEILNLKQVGIKDSFFELGGDSIKAIRIISKLRDIGYTVAVKDIMNGKTVEAIAKLLRISSDTEKYEQGEVYGKIEATPIIREFAQWNLAKPEHFNQSMMFSVNGIDNAVIKTAIEEIIKHHDALRAVYRDSILEILPINKSKLCDFYEYDYSDKEDKYKVVEAKCTEIQGSIDLEAGPLTKVAVFTVGEDKVMMFCIHHLVVDGVSWRILAEDFETAVKQITKGEVVKLPAKTISFIEWSKKLKEYGDNQSAQEKEYWSKVQKELKDGLVVGEFAGECPGRTSVKFDKTVTNQLLKKSTNIYGAKIDEVLLAGLAKAIGNITGQKKVAVKIESHGREELRERISNDRTVGWFTNVYAVNIECCEDNEKAIIVAKDTLRSVPESGMGYGYVEHECVPDIGFNYLGDFSENKSTLTSEYRSGNDIAEANQTNDKILINGYVSEGNLEFTILSLKNDFGQIFIETLKEEFKKSIEMLAKYCDNVVKYEEIASNNIATININVEEIKEESLELLHFTEPLSIIKEVKEDKWEQFYERELYKYSENYRSDCEEKYVPIGFQKLFFCSYKEPLCKIIIKAQKNISKDMIIRALKSVIKEQSTLRSSYYQNNGNVVENKYQDDWYIPYTIKKETDIDNSMIFPIVKQKMNIQETQKGVITPFIIVEKQLSGEHFIYLYIHHGLWDEFSSTILLKRLRSIIGGETGEKYYKYSDYIKSRDYRCSSANKIVDSYLLSCDKFNKQISKTNKKSCLLDITFTAKKEDIIRFNNDPMRNIINLIIAINPELMQLDTFPIGILYHGRNDFSDEMLGMKLIVLPAIYDISKKELIGGLEMIDLKNKNTSIQFDDDYYCKVKNNYILNYHGVFSDEYSDEDEYLKKKFTDSVVILDNVESELTCVTFGDNILKLVLPVFVDDIDIPKEKLDEILSMAKRYLENR